MGARASPMLHPSTSAQWVQGPSLLLHLNAGTHFPLTFADQTPLPNSKVHLFKQHQLHLILL